MGLLNDYWEDEKFLLGTAPKHLQYIFNVGLGVSQFINVCLGGDVDESISSRLGRCQLDPEAPKFFKKLANGVDKVFGKNHCLNALESSLSRQKEIWAWSSKTDYPKPGPIRKHF